MDTQIPDNLLPPIAVSSRCACPAGDDGAVLQAPDCTEGSPDHPELRRRRIDLQALSEEA